MTPQPRSHLREDRPAMPKKYRMKNDQAIVVDDLYRITMRMPVDVNGSKGRRCELEIERLCPPIRIDRE